MTELNKEFQSMLELYFEERVGVFQISGTFQAMKLYKAMKV
jgi:hypothetical protein